MSPDTARAVLAPSRETAAERVEFETLISDISARLIAATPERAEPAIKAALEDVRTFFQADRCAFVRVQADQTFAHVAYGAYAAGLPSLPTDLNLVQAFPWARHKLLVERVPAVFRRLADLPPDAAVDRASWDQYSPLRSHLAVPIPGEPAVRHIVAIHWAERECEFPDSYVPRLRVLGEMIVNALRRKQAFEDLRASEERLDLAAASARCGLWELDLGTGAVWATPQTREIYGLAAGSTADYDLLMRLVHEADREAVVAAIDKAMTDRNPFDETYRIVRADGAVRWIHVRGRACADNKLLGASVDVTDQVAAAEQLRQALADVQRLREKVESENVYLREEARRRLGPQHVIGRGPAIRRTLALAEQVALTDSTVLLLGETGVGKERFASYIHESSRRRDRPMIRVNCSAIPAPLIESELFGREKGAYTGALSKQLGRFELAHGSTLFLDEIGELSVEIQVKLLRVLETHSIERLGNPRPVPIDVRIVAATNRDLAAAVHAGRFREDLFYRLNVFPITIPPLRERREDISLFVQAFVDELAVGMGKRIDEVDAVSMEALLAYDWPGNVRELRNVVERAMIMATGPTLRIDPPHAASVWHAPATDARALARARILQVLQDTGWRIRGPHGAAARLGLNASTLESRMRRLGLTRPGTAGQRS